MKPQLIAVVVLFSVTLAACQTVQEVAIENAKQVCTESGYGEGSPNYGPCMMQLTPAAAQIEQQRRSALIQSGTANIANSLPQPVYAQQPAPAISTPAAVTHRPTWCMHSNIGGQIVCQ